MNKFWNAVATITGGTIGAGLLAIPYVINKAGFWTGLISLVGLGIAFLFVNLCLGEIILRTKGDHQLTGYSQIYLGNAGKLLMAVSMIFGIYGALMVYTIGAGDALSNLLGFDKELWMIIFYLIMIFIVYFDLKVLGESEFFIGIIKLLAFLALLFFIFRSPSFDFNNLKGFDITKVFVPYGVLLFSYVGTTVIVASKEVLGKNLRKFRNVITISSILIIITYLLFTIAVLGLNNAASFEIATSGISSLGYLELLIANILALLTMTTPFIALSYGLKEMYVHDYNINDYIAWLVTIIPPALLLLFTRSFVNIIEITGAVTVGIAGALIILIYQNAKKKGQRKPEYTINIPQPLMWLFLLLFISGSIIVLYQ